ncbi:AHH domain-containing protein [Xanthomonas campestris pv. campestris]|uniref:hypothetical protein n=1 Tax=Xanthomonas campestris TaxID=339 RepID=UPI0038908B10
MPAQPVILQSHHVIEQSLFSKDPILKELVDNGLIDEHASSNRLYLPVDGKLADQLELTPHRGRTRSSYTKGIGDVLEDMQSSADGIAALNGDAVALKRVASQVAELQDTLKVALISRP